MIDVGRICAVTFGDAVGAFFLGIVLGFVLLWLTIRAFDRPDQ